MKILAPAGNFESLKTAIYNGADEVYLGINDFNARNNIDGFSLGNLKEAVDYAHLYNVKVLVAVNILFSDDELSDALDLVVNAYNLGVDAFIVQDLGLISLIYENYPCIEIHASTQMGLHNLEGVKQVLKYGVKRVVLARETPLSEVKRIKENTNVEIEYFAHGALCVSFSGNCYLSSYMFNASGNRGRCKQLCRLFYSLEDNGKTLKSGYLLSAKDINMLSRLTDMEEAGVDVLKIEGRARRPFYVGAITKAYRQALDGKPYDLDEVKLAFNRNYTEGYFNGNSNVISSVNNHIGVKIGKVISVNFGRKFNEVVIYSDRNLSSKSVFKTFNNGQESASFTAYDLKKTGGFNYKITTTHNIKKGDDVHLISDYLKEREYSDIENKRQIAISLELAENMPICATININGRGIKVFGQQLLSAKNSPITEAELLQNFSKSNLFTVQVNIEKLDRVFITKQALNEFRRKVFDRAYEEITGVFYRNLSKIFPKKPKIVASFADYKSYGDNDSRAKNVIYSPSEYLIEDVFKKQKECSEKGEKLYLDTPFFALKEDIQMLKSIIEATNIPIIANNYYALDFNTEIVIGAGLNVYNLHTANAHKKAFVCAENEVGHRLDAPYMVLRHCPLKEHIGSNCTNCKYKDGLEIKSENGKRFKLKRVKVKSFTFYLN